jgi:lysozyme family protein
MSYIKHKMVDFTKNALDWKDTTMVNIKPLVEFAEALRKEIRGIKFASKDDKSLYVFMEGEYMCMGWIGYGDYLKYTSPDQSSFVVYSRHISNEKYDPYRSEQHYMKQSVNMTTAIKNCKKYLRNYNTVEMADIQLGDVKSHATKRVEKINREVRDQIANVLDTSTYKPETSGVFNTLRHILKSNIELPDKEFKDKLVKMYDKYDEYMKNKSVPVNMLYIKVYERLGKRTFDVINIGRVATGKEYNASLHYQTLKEKSLEKYDDDTISEYIVGKISVLSMVEPETYVDDVGFRSKIENTFYVVRDDE